MTVANKLKHVGVFKQIIHVFVYICILFCFIVLLNLEYTLISIWPKKLTVMCYQWCILWKGIADEHSLFSKILLSQALSIHCLWLITHGWTPMSCFSVDRKKDIWAESLKQAGIIYSWYQGHEGNIFPPLSWQWQFF